MMLPLSLSQWITHLSGELLQSLGIGNLITYTPSLISSYSDRYYKAALNEVCTPGQYEIYTF